MTKLGRYNSTLALCTSSLFTCWYCGVFSRSLAIQPLFYFCSLLLLYFEYWIILFSLFLFLYLLHWSDIIEVLSDAIPHVKNVKPLELHEQVKHMYNWHDVAGKKYLLDGVSEDWAIRSWLRITPSDRTHVYICVCVLFVSCFLFSVFLIHFLFL